MKNNIYKIISILLVGVSGFFIGKHFEKIKKNINCEEKEVRMPGYKFINPLLECDNLNQTTLSSSMKLEKRIKKFIDSSVSTGHASQISFYFRDLNNGPWIGIGEKDNYFPASLLKVPIMVAMFKKTETDTSFLKKEIKFIENSNTNVIPNIKDSVIKIGNSYSVEKLIYYMIVYSDNNAKTLLLENIEPSFITKVFSDLGIDFPVLDNDKDFMSVKTYSSFFRILYNATYLNKDNSEKALQILSKSDFRQGIPSLLPDSVLIAHKFGERGYVNSDIKQLHDCGIVYEGKTPYLICVMSRGTNINELTKIIAEISLIVYTNN